MTAGRLSAVLLPVGIAVAIAAAWPLSAMAIHPLALPGLLGVGAMTWLILWRPDAGLALALTLAPLTNLVVGGVKPLQFLLPALAFGMLAFGLLTRRDEQPARIGALSAAMLAYVVMSIVATLTALEPAESVNTLFGRLTAVALFFAVAQICATRGQRHVVIAGALVGLLVAAIHGHLQALLGLESDLGVVVDGEVIARIQGSFGHPNQYAGFLAVLLPLAAALMVRRGVSGRMRLLGAAAMIAALSPLFASYTRGALLGLAVGSLLWLTFVRPRMAVATLLVAGALGALIAPAALKERLRDNSSGDIGLRADLWRSALDIYGEAPLVGVGLSNFAEAYARLPATVSEGSQRRLLHQTQVLIPPHANNLYLTVLAEQGILGLAVFVILLMAGLLVAHRLSRLKDPTDAALGIGLGAGLCIIAVHSVLEHTLTSELSLPLFALLGVASRAAVTRPAAQD